MTAISVNHLTGEVTVPQDHPSVTLVTGTLYKMDTDEFRKSVNTYLASEDGMPLDDAYVHNTEVTVAGTTFARTLAFNNNFSYTMSPDILWSLRLEGSNNNLFDIENGILNQNSVQVIPTNSAGLIAVQTGGLNAAQDTKITETHAQLHSIEGGRDFKWMFRVMYSILTGNLDHSSDSSILNFWNMMKTKVRATVTVDPNNYDRLDGTYDGDE